MTTSDSLAILHALRAEHLRLADKALAHKHEPGVLRHTRQARAIEEGIKALQVLEGQRTAGAHDPLPCGAVLFHLGQHSGDTERREWWTGGVWLQPGQLVAVVVPPPEPGHFPGRLTPPEIARGEDPEGL